jgi:hypothetical protein
MVEYGVVYCTVMRCTRREEKIRRWGFGAESNASKPTDFNAKVRIRDHAGD